MHKCVYLIQLNIFILYNLIDIATCIFKQICKTEISFLTQLQLYKYFLLCIVIPMAWRWLSDVATLKILTNANEYITNNIQNDIHQLCQQHLISRTKFHMVRVMADWLVGKLTKKKEKEVSTLISFCWFTD
jgi:hypothetical protein